MHAVFPPVGEAHTLSLVVSCGVGVADAAADAIPIGYKHSVAIIRTGALQVRKTGCLWARGLRSCISLESSTLWCKNQGLYSSEF